MTLAFETRRNGRYGCGQKSAANPRFAAHRLVGKRLLLLCREEAEKVIPEIKQLVENAWYYAVRECGVSDA